MIHTEAALTAHRATRGDHEPFAELIRCHQQAVFNVAWRMLGNTQDAEDAVQETFLRAYRFWHTFDASRPAGPWLKRITVNVCLGRLNRSTPDQPLEEDLLQPPDPQPGPEAQVEQRSLQERLRSELLRLPPRYRAVIELRHYQELSYEEIAATLERPLSDVKSDLFRARKLLSARLRELQPETAQ
jgi:RNA polymerase sigma-70 factor (ECF subfamily)